jgi:ATP-binding cassette subfamily C protein LapB
MLPFPPVEPVSLTKWKRLRGKMRGPNTNPERMRGHGFTKIRAGAECAAGLPGGNPEGAGEPGRVERAAKQFVRFVTTRIPGGPDLPRFGSGPVFASFVINVLSLAMPLVILQVYDRIIPSHAYGTLSLLVIGLSIALLLDAMLRIVRSYIIGWNGARFEHLLSTAAVEHLLLSDSAAYENDTPGAHLARINAIDTLRNFHSGQAKALLVDLPFVGLFLALIWFIAGPLVLVPLGLLALLALASLALGRYLRHSIKTQGDIDERRHSFIIEVLRGIHTVKGLGMEAPMLRRYERLQEAAALATYDTAFLSDLARSMGVLFANVTLVAVASIGALFVINGQLSIGGLAACTLLAGRIIQPMLRAAGLATEMERVIVARDRVAELFRTSLETPSVTPVVPTFAGAIEFRNVSYRHKGNDAYVFRNISMRIEPGEMVAISGEGGSGKSTLLSLITRLALPTEGEVLIDGVSTAKIDPLQLRQKIAYLSQSPSLMRGTIMENLTLFRKGEAIDNAMAAGRLVGLDQVVNRLPRGYDTVVGDGAEGNLPAGVVQSIANARALAGARPIILFDEAQRGLDATADQNLRKALASLKGTATIVIVSFRPSLTALADRRFHLQDGSLQEATAPVPADRNISLPDAVVGHAREA